MKRALHSGIKSVLQLGMATVPRSVYTRLVPQDVIGLCYHTVSDEWPAHVAHICPFKSSTAFRDDMVWLTGNFEVIGYEEACRRKSSVRRSRSPAVVVTVDDGYRECLTVIAPILQELKIPAIFFVTTNFIDNRQLFYRNAASLCIDALDRLGDSDQQATARLITQSQRATDADIPAIRQWLLDLGPENGSSLDATCRILGIDVEAFLKQRRPYLTRDEVRSLRSSGFTIGAHGTAHCHLAGLPHDHLEAELAGSCHTIAELTGDRSVPFAFPFSGHRVDRASVTAIRARNPHVGLLFDSRGILPAEETTVHRISADTPPDDEASRRTVLPSLMQKSYESELRQQWIAPLKSLLHVR
ncbi:MAG: hypothetical protein CMJ59_05855 [Planctomycetaceae bacterium]|nr:hypothetical protein [Planctomycetaceae bacterium]